MSAPRCRIFGVNLVGVLPFATTQSHVKPRFCPNTPQTRAEPGLCTGMHAMVKSQQAHPLIRGTAAVLMTLGGACAVHASNPVVPAPAADDGVSRAAEPPSDSYADNDPTALQDFHPALDAHGTWVDDPTYGTVWTPSEAETGPGFVPYVSGGHWVYGNDYLWTSDYSWGWAPFHYGRWVHLEARGWSWIPGREYAPAWVEWRTGDAYLGWAPAPPLFVWQGGVAVTLGFAPPAFVFCSHADLFSPQPARVVISGPRAARMGMETHLYAAPGPNGHFHAGPPLASLRIAPEHVVRATGRERGLERAQAFSRPSSASRLGGHPPATRGEAHKEVFRRASEPRQTRSEAPRPMAHSTVQAPKKAHAEAPHPKAAHAEALHPKAAHAQAPRAEGRAERQAVQPHQASRALAARSEPPATHPQASHVETHSENRTEPRAAAPVTHAPQQHSSSPANEQKK
jgi:hypothetical protein